MAEKFAEIHIWMFNKIKLQNHFSEEIVKQLSDETQVLQIRTYVEQSFPFPTGNLDEIIDHDNIHQWLEKHLVSTDRKLAWILSQVKDNPLTIKNLEDIFFHIGNQHRDLYQPVWLKPSYVYRTITDALTEGMPCDKANQVISHDENHLTWKVSQCMHQESWQSQNAEVNDFYAIRDAWIQGLLDGSEFTYSSKHPQYHIQRN
jgi:hypothetical protein